MLLDVERMLTGFRSFIVARLTMLSFPVKACGAL